MDSSAAQHPLQRLVVSAAVQQPSSKAWMAQIRPVESLLDMALLLAHPTQFVAATTVVESLLCNPALTSKLGQQHWPSRAWQGISVVVNRCTPEHQDAHGLKEAFDLLLAAGAAQGAQLKMLGTALQYRPGTIVFVTAKIVTHSVDEWPDMDRICYAQWLRSRSVQEHSPSSVDWCRISTVRSHWELLGALGKRA
jgi:hypothetical protein